MESQKIKNLLNHKDETYSKYQTKKWYIINDRNNGNYSEDNGNDKGIKIDTKVVKPFLCDYADAYILVTGDIAVTRGNGNTKVAFKICHPFTKCKIHLNDESVEDSENLDIIMNMYNLIEYSDNYSDSTASLYQFKRHEPLENNADLTDASSLFSYTSALLETTETQIAANANPNIPLTHRLWRNVQIIVPLKYISSFLRLLEMPLTNTKLHIQLNYTKYSVISSGFREPGADEAVNSSTFKITKTELYVPTVTLNTEDNNKLNQLLDTEIKRTVYWNEYKSKIETITQAYNDNNYKRTLLDTAIPGVNRLFVAGFNDYDATADGNAEPQNSINTPAYKVERNGFTKYFLPRVDIKDYSVLIDGRNFYDQNISDDFKKYEEVRKVMTGRGEDYTTGSLLDFDYWKNNYKLICCDLSKQKVLDSNPRVNHTKAAPGTKAQTLTVLEKGKETNLVFNKGTVKVYYFYNRKWFNTIK